MWYWVTVVGVVLLDLAIRFLTPWTFDAVLVGEGVLLLAGAVVLAGVTRRSRAPTPGRRRLRWGVAVACALAGVRSLVWGLGTHVMVANGAALVMGVAGVAVGLRVARRRRREVRPPSRPD